MPSSCKWSRLELSFPSRWKQYATSLTFPTHAQIIAHQTDDSSRGNTHVITPTYSTDLRLQAQLGFKIRQDDPKRYGKRAASSIDPTSYTRSKGIRTSPSTTNERDATRRPRDFVPQARIHRSNTVREREGGCREHEDDAESPDPTGIHSMVVGCRGPGYRPRGDEGEGGKSEKNREERRRGDSIV